MFMERLIRLAPVQRVWRAVPYVVLSAAAGLVLILASQLRAVRADLVEWRNRAERPYAGMVVPAFTATTLAGDQVRIGENTEAGRQVLFIFNTKCAYCRMMIPIWNELVDRIHAQSDMRVQIFGISLDGEKETRQYASQEGLRYPVLTATDARFVSLYRVQGIPLTMVLDSEGRVLHARSGSFPLENRLAADSILAAVASPPEPGMAPRAKEGASPEVRD